jgi:hypothetical protein
VVTFRLFTNTQAASEKLVETSRKTGLKTFHITKDE